MIAAARRPSEPTALAEIIARDLVPLAGRIDAEGLYPGDILSGLGAGGAFAAHASGASEDLAAAVEITAEIGAACGSTAFCAWCQNALVWYLARTDNASLRDRHLPALMTGTRLGGTGLSNPVKALAGLDTFALKGERVAGGWRITGRLPWVSNLGPDHLFASVFTCGDQRIMALFDCGDAGVTLAEGAPFIGLEGTRTHPVLLRGVFVPDDRVLAEDAAAFIAGVRQGFVLLQMGMALGVGRAAVAQMRRDGAARSLHALLPVTPEALEAEAESLTEAVRRQVLIAGDSGRPAFLETLRLRLRGSHFALRAAEANLIAQGARGYLRGADAARTAREAHFVAIVTPSMKHIWTELQRDAA